MGATALNLASGPEMTRNDPFGPFLDPFGPLSETLSGPNPLCFGMLWLQNPCQKAVIFRFFRGLEQYGRQSDSDDLSEPVHATNGSLRWSAKGV